MDKPCIVKIFNSEQVKNVDDFNAEISKLKFRRLL